MEKQIKYCPKCKKMLPVSAFWKSSYSHDGLQGYCKECQKANVRKIYNRLQRDYSNIPTEMLVAELRNRGYQVTMVIEPKDTNKLNDTTMIALTDKERQKYVSGRWLRCIEPINTVRKGEGCKVGENYWFEYIHDEGQSFYRKLSDNYHYDEVYITDRELIENFEIV